MTRYTEAGDPQDVALGEELIRAGKVGCIVLAGGEGSRLGWNGPKGTYPIASGKTLFDLLIEKHEAASQAYEYPLKLAVMCSPRNHEKTRGALPPEIPLFCQKMLPLLDENRQEMPLERPNGNGEVLNNFVASDLFDAWKREGIEYIQIILVDNPLAAPYDPNQIGVHAHSGAEVTIKAVKKEEVEGKVGLIGWQGEKLTVVEYSEDPPEEWTLANTSLFSFSIDFIDRIHQMPLPVHFVKKEVNGQSVFIREYFIFDLLRYAKKAEAILYPKEATFSPLKVKKDLSKLKELF